MFPSTPKKKPTIPKSPDEFGEVTRFPHRVSYPVFSKNLSEKECEKLNQSSDLSELFPEEIRPNVMFINLDFTSKSVSCVYEKDEIKPIPKNYKHFFPNKISVLRPKDWSKKGINPNDQFLSFLKETLQHGYILEKIIINQLVFRPISPAEKPEYLLVDRSAEDYQPITKNITVLQDLIQTSAEKGYRFLGGFLGALTDRGLEYSGWLFVTDPVSEKSMSRVVPIGGNFSDQRFFLNPGVLEVLELWNKEGWELLSVVYSMKKEEKALQYYPIVKFFPYLVMRQVRIIQEPEKIPEIAKISKIPDEEEKESKEESVNSGREGARKKTRGGSPSKSSRSSSRKKANRLSLSESTSTSTRSPKGSSRSGVKVRSRVATGDSTEDSNTQHESTSEQKEELSEKITITTKKRSESNTKKGKKVKKITGSGETIINKDKEEKKKDGGEDTQKQKETVKETENGKEDI